MDPNCRRGLQPSTSNTKIERRIIEKNRRNQMKELYSKLNSLIPNYKPREEVLSVADQIDEAIKYIKRLGTKVKVTKEKKQSFLKRKRSGGSTLKTKGSLKSPKMEIREFGSALDVVFTCGFDYQFVFNEIIRILHEDNIEVVRVNSSLLGDSIINFAHAEIPPSFYQFGTTKISDRLKCFVKDSVNFEINDEMWDLPDLELFIDDSLEIRRKGSPDVTGIRRLEKELEAIKQEMRCLRIKLEEKQKKKDKAYESILKLKELYDEEITRYYKYSSFTSKVHQLAEEKDIAALDELSHSEVGKFMVEWNTDKAFREDYEKKVLQSLERRQLNRDGRRRLAE